MEPGLFGLQPEASSCFAYGLILRAHKAQFKGSWVVKGAQFHDYVYVSLVIEHLLSKNVADDPAVFNLCCLSDSLLGN